MLNLLTTLCFAVAGTGDPDDAPYTATDVQRTISAGVEWLLENQRENGCWGSHHSPRWYEVLCDVPGSHHAFRLATTGLCIVALQDSGDPSPRVREAIDRGIDALIAQRDLKRASGMEHYSVWGYGYALQAIGEVLVRLPDHPRATELRETAEFLIDKLAGSQCLDGGWGYLSIHEVPTRRPSWTSMSFTTAALLVGLDRARAAGIELPAAMIRKAVRSVERCRTPTGSYTYGEMWNGGPGSGINQLKGAACRTPCNQYAVERFGSDIAAKDHVRSLDDLLVRHARFQEISLRRPVPHESHYAISGYFYLFGHAYAAYVLEEQPAEVQQKYGQPLVRAVMKCAQPDGSFWDYPLYSYHKPYGTAYALIALSRASVPEVIESPR